MPICLSPVTFDGGEPWIIANYRRTRNSIGHEPGQEPWFRDTLAYRSFKLDGIATISEAACVNLQEPKLLQEKQTTVGWISRRLGI